MEYLHCPYLYSDKIHLEVLIMAKYKQMLLAGSFASTLLLGACGNEEKTDDTKTEDASKEESTEESTEEETTEESAE